MSSSSKRFFRSASEFRKLVPEMGPCIATDHIVVEGRRVGWMERVEWHAGGSGWQFYSGLESEEYLDDLEHLDFYAVNTVANYDPDIIPFLDAPVGSAFERDRATGTFRAVVDPAENTLFPPAAAAEGLNPGFAAVVGPQPLPDGWSIDLPCLFNRRVEGERRVFGRPGVTVYLSLERIERPATPDQRLDHMKKIIPPHAFALEETRGERLARLGYRVDASYRGEEGDRPLHVFYGFAFTAGGYADLTIYCDHRADIATARQVWLGVRHAEPV
jgi:hypothetical protein